MAQARPDNVGASPRGEFTIANAYVMTMDKVLSDIADGSASVARMSKATSGAFIPIPHIAALMRATCWNRAAPRSRRG